MRAATEFLTEAAKAAPPVAVAGATIGGIAVPAIIQYLTLMYVAGLVVHMAYKGGRWCHRVIAGWRNPAP